MKDKKINLLEITPSMLIGGAENVARTLTYKLNKNHFNVSLISFYGHIEGEWPCKIRKYVLYKKPGFKIKVFFQLINNFKKEKPDIIHNHYIYSLPYIIIANLFSVKARIVQTIHCDFNHFSNQLLWKMVAVLFKVYLVDLSPSLNPQLQKISKHYNIANGIDISKFRRIRQGSNAQNNILFIGRLEHQKDPLLAINLFNEIVKKEKFHLKIIGLGSLENKLRQTIKDLNLSRLVRLVNKKVSPIPEFKNYRFLIVTSRWEAMPLLIIEAMAAGMIIFSTNAGAVKDLIIDGRSGFIFKENDPEKMARFFINKIKKYDLEKISKQARLRSKLFSDDKMVRNYEKLFKQINEK